MLCLTGDINPGFLVSNEKRFLICFFPYIVFTTRTYLNIAVFRRVLLAAISENGNKDIYLEVPR